MLAPSALAQVLVPTGLTLLAAVALAAPDAGARERKSTRGSATCLAPQGTNEGLVVGIEGNGDLRLADGRLLTLAGILLAPGPADNAVPRPELGALLGSEVHFHVLQPAADRWGRLSADILLPKSLAGAQSASRSVSGEAGSRKAKTTAEMSMDLGAEPAYTVAQWLVDAGLARAAPDAAVTPLSRPCMKALLAREDKARADRRGQWEDAAAVLAASEPEAILAKAGDFAVIEGIIVSVREREHVTYLNFGSQWTRDFTVTIWKKNRAKFAAAGLRFAELDGRRIRVRGMVEAGRGPLIDVLTPEQIEVIGTE
ncbi:MULTISPECIES: hypothetical protein [unclassified Chelatococcus]|uniref:hypothetical protein n=1 Tax=unclassified Chelatococcus TaxID=2638111 RepID=UPI001BCF14CD|nr:MULTISPECIES: hypothetical protein [unclassified Chelatococcus]MBS7696706.1 hypothetical protein [Chelatococcus sp. YT9]MBX3555271.1 hypothetical protein [Chelatococcus sp.]